MDKVEKKKYLKRLEAKRKSRRRRIKKFLDFRKSEPKTSKFNSIASSPLPGPMSVGRSLGSGPGSVDIISQTSN
jgi:hypothetical protein